MRLFTGFFFLILFLSSVSSVYAQDEVLASNINHRLLHHERMDRRTPMTLNGEHMLHAQGQWMLSYRYMQMRMSGSRDGHHRVSNSEVLGQYMEVPTRMTMQTHMLDFMVAPFKQFNVMVMLPFLRNDMHHRMRGEMMDMGMMGMMAGPERTYRAHSGGLGDLQLMGLINLFDNQKQHVHLNMGMSFPTGSINEKHDTPMGTDIRLPYGMQLGSGTWDLLPGLTYTGQFEKWSWGTQAMATIRPGRNRIGYSLGNRYEVTSWIAHKWVDWVSNSVGLKYSIWQNVGGQDPLLDPSMMAMADPKSQGGKRLDFLFGADLFAPKGFLQGQRLAVDFGIPVMQSLDGPQLETDWYFTTGWEASFG